MTNYTEAELRQRFVLLKNEWRPDGIDCEHPLCEKFHSRGCPPPALRTEWVIWDTVTDDRADAEDGSDAYELRRDAKRVLDRWIARVLAGTARTMPVVRTEPKGYVVC